MAQLPWIQGFLFIILQLTVTAERTSVIKRAGDEAMLSCSELIDGQQKCRDTTWIFTASRSRTTETLFDLGQKKQINSFKPDRLSLTSNCSLVIKEVREEDAGLYLCQQWDTRDKHTLFHESDIYLSVVNLIEQKENHGVTLSCSVVTYDPCPYKVQWFYQDVTNKESPSESVCSANVTLSSGSKVPQCKVTQSGSDEEFTFSLQPSGGKVQPTRKPGNRKTTRPNQNNVPPTPEEKSGGKLQPTTKPASTTTTSPKPDNVSKISKEKSGEVQPTTKPASTRSTADNVSKILKGRSDVTQTNNGTTIPSVYKVVIPVAVVSVSILISAVVIIIWRAKGKKTKAGENAVELEDDVSYATIRHAKETKRNSPVVQHDAVTYSTMAACSSSAAAADDPNKLYSFITSIN